MISVQNLKKSYGPVKAVNDVTFEVNKGEIVGFLGPNGAGKSTTMKILTCFIGATEGRASIGGFDVETHPLEVRKKIGYLPENAPVYMDMDVLSYLRFMAEVREMEPSKAAQKIDEITTTCGLKNVIRRPISQLSKGYRQRVGLAQAMVHDPDVLILDEPTSGLDPNQIIEIRELIKRIGKEKTVILSTHILPEVSATCDRAIIISKGAIVGQGTLEELSSGAHGVVKTTIRGERNAVEGKLQALAGVRAVHYVGQRDGLNAFEVTPEKGKSLNEDIFRLAADSGWSLQELKSEEASLEDVFTQLTRN